METVSLLLVVGDSVIVAGGRGHGEDSGSTVAKLVVWKEVMYKC